MDNIALLILGIFISVIGIVNMTRNISTIHSYNRRKVKEEDVPKYGRAVGTGTLIIGVSLIAAFVTTFWSEKAMSFIVIPALVIGLGFILYAQFKYEPSFALRVLCLFCTNSLKNLLTGTLVDSLSCLWRRFL